MDDRTPPFTRSDIEVEHWTAEWGALCAFVTIKRPGSYYDGRCYGLRSAKGLEHATKKSHWHYLVDQEPPRGEANGATVRMGDFLGSMGTGDLEKAIDGLLADFTKWDCDQREDRSQIAGQLSELSEALRELDEWNPIRTEVTLRSRWPRARELFLQVEMGLFEPPVPSVAPEPPVWPWHSRVALLDVPSADGRTMRSSGRYTLRGGDSVLLRLEGQGHHLGEPVGHLHHLRADLREGQSALWAYGTATDRDVARQLTSGQLFASVSLMEDSEYELGDVFWQGGTVYDAVALPADQYPWRS
jgi:hypothetical protein